MATDHCPHRQPPGCQTVSPTCGVHKVRQRRPTASQPPLQGRHPRANRRTLIDPIPTVLSQVTAACPVFMASRDGQHPIWIVTRPVVMSETAQHATTKPAPTPQRGLMDTRCCGGGPEGIRTPDLLTASQTRSQLRHGPTVPEEVMIPRTSDPTFRPRYHLSGRHI